MMLLITLIISDFRSFAFGLKTAEAYESFKVDCESRLSCFGILKECNRVFDHGSLKKDKVIIFHIHDITNRLLCLKVKM